MDEDNLKISKSSVPILFIIDFTGEKMLLFVWRHSKRFSSWSMLDEPHIHKENYLQADVTVLATSKAEVLSLEGPARRLALAVPNYSCCHRVETIPVSLSRADLGKSALNCWVHCKRVTEIVANSQLIDKLESKMKNTKGKEKRLM